MDASATIARFVVDFVDEVNSGKIEAALSRFSQNASIMEDIPPFKWQGPDAGSQWLSAMAANADRIGVTSVAMVLGDARRIEVEGQAAYAIFGGTVHLKQPPRALQEPGLLTFTFGGGIDGWLITGLTWTGGRPKE